MRANVRCVCLSDEADDLVSLAEEWLCHQFRMALVDYERDSMWSNIIEAVENPSCVSFEVLIGSLTYLPDVTVIEVSDEMCEAFCMMPFRRPLEVVFDILVFVSSVGLSSFRLGHRPIPEASW